MPAEITSTLLDWSFRFGLPMLAAIVTPERRGGAGAIVVLQALQPLTCISKENGMNSHFERTGPLTELTSYPQWAQDMVADCASTKQSVVDHALWARMSDGTLGRDGTINFMCGIWPVIERFPGYMAMSLLKTQYGRSAGGQFALLTRSGTNQFHGTVFEYFRNAIFDANAYFNKFYANNTFDRPKERGGSRGRQASSLRSRQARALRASAHRAGVAF